MTDPIYIYIYLSFLWIFTSKLDHLLTIKSKTHKTREGNHQSIYNTVMPLFLTKTNVTENYKELQLNFGISMGGGGGGGGALLFSVTVDHSRNNKRAMMALYPSTG